MWVVHDVSNRWFIGPFETQIDACRWSVADHDYRNTRELPMRHTLIEYVAEPGRDGDPGYEIL